MSNRRHSEVLGLRKRISSPLEFNLEKKLFAEIFKAVNVEQCRWTRKNVLLLLLCIFEARWTKGHNQSTKGHERWGWALLFDYNFTILVILVLCPDFWRLMIISIMIPYKLSPTHIEPKLLTQSFPLSVHQFAFEVYHVISCSPANSLHELM